MENSKLKIVRLPYGYGYKIQDEGVSIGAIVYYQDRLHVGGILNDVELKSLFKFLSKHLEDEFKDMPIYLRYYEAGYIHRRAFISNNPSPRMISIENKKLDYYVNKYKNAKKPQYMTQPYCGDDVYPMQQYPYSHFD